MSVRAHDKCLQCLCDYSALKVKVLNIRYYFEPVHLSQLKVFNSSIRNIMCPSSVHNVNSVFMFCVLFVSFFETYSLSLVTINL